MVLGVGIRGGWLSPLAWGWNRACCYVCDVGPFLGAINDPNGTIYSAQAVPLLSKQYPQKGHGLPQVP